jgi:hypothetical protein
VWQKRLSRFGQPYRPRIAPKERLPELALQIPYLGAYRRLGHHDAPRCASELAFLGDRYEVRKLAKIHNETL